MRRSVWSRVLAALLIISMCVTPASAAGRSSRNSGSKSFWNSWSSWDFWDFWGNMGNNSSNSTQKTKPTQPAETTEPTEATQSTEPAEVENSDSELTLVESADTVENGELLRANTFALRSVSPAAETTEVKYFPVTMLHGSYNSLK